MFHCIIFVQHITCQIYKTRLI
uniref:Uncharacterized protein n=1 Tax=Anguilla anguilla TaxID=7936 RepID=A0A0E9QWQ2_ANGAN